MFICTDLLKKPEKTKADFWKKVSLNVVFVCGYMNKIIFFKIISKSLACCVCGMKVWSLRTKRRFHRYVGYMKIKCFFKMISRKCPSPYNVFSSLMLIFMGKHDFFLTIMCFTPKRWYLLIFGAKTVFSKLSPELSSIVIFSICPYLDMWAKSTFSL